MKAGVFQLSGALAMLALLAIPAAAQRTAEVTIREYRFTPQEVRIQAGDSVKWTNREKRTSHSVLFPAENALESERLFPDESWQRTFLQPGIYRYRCGPHEEMTGVVIVEMKLSHWRGFSGIFGLGAPSNGAPAIDAPNEPATQYAELAVDAGRRDAPRNLSNQGVQ